MNLQPATLAYLRRLRWELDFERAAFDVAIGETGAGIDPLGTLTDDARESYASLTAAAAQVRSRSRESAA